MDLKESPAGSQPGMHAPDVQYRSFEDLRVYCYRVASVVGLVCIRVFGYRDRAAEPLAENLGLAFRLTNIIRDVKGDAAMGRVYLSQEELEKFDVSPSELHSNGNSARLPILVRSIADRAPADYRAGDELSPPIEHAS